LGRDVPGDRARRANVEAAIATVRAVWSGTAGGVGGFLRPDPPPPIIVGGFGPKMAEVAGRLGDGINAPAGQLSSLLSVARDACKRSGRDPARFIVTASSGGSARDQERLSELGVHRALVFVRPPYRDAIERLAADKDGRP
jgi:alkanesulfonate monooxygenase SsuD/methylene tetrahydromethanopterin reductase-like flavin-dependent oxidoreductase (luciferase family)